MDTAGDKIWPVSMHLYHAMVQSDNKMWLVCVCSFYVPWFEQLLIVASNDINEDTIHSLNHQVHTSPSLASSTKTRYTHSTIRYTHLSLTRLVNEDTIHSLNHQVHTSLTRLVFISRIINQYWSVTRGNNGQVRNENKVREMSGSEVPENQWK